MSTALSITITPTAQALLQRIGNPQALLIHVQKAMQVAMDGDDGVRTNVVEKHLSAHPHPTDPKDHSLGVVTNRLRSSVWTTTTPTATGVDARIGSNVVYAPLHEYGGTVKRVMLAGSVRLRADAKGLLLKGVARFASKKSNKKGELKHKRFVNVPYAGGKRFEIVYPERAPFRTGVAEKLDDMGQAVSKAIVDYWKGLSP